MIDLEYMEEAADTSNCVACERKLGNEWRVKIELASKPKGTPHRWHTWAIRCDNDSCKYGAKIMLLETFGRDLGGYVWRGLK